VRAVQVLAVGVATLAMTACQGPAAPRTVVVYTSLDQPFSEPVLRAFEQRTGIQVKPVYDVEAAKTTGLAARLAAEAHRPTADVFWSSEYAQTLLLRAQGVTAPYASPAAADIPALFRDPEHYWTGFAARARVIIVNTRRVPPDHYPTSIFALTDSFWGPGEVGIANPLFGTTATHAAALFAALGPERAKQYLLALRSQGVRVVAGNSVVRDMVVSGALKVGLTDTDDACVALAEGRPVAMILPDQGTLGTLLIPNTVSLVRGAPHPDEARRLIDFLVSADTEAMLARAASRQIPVRASVSVPDDVRDLRHARAMRVHPQEVARHFTTSARWLRETFLR
jgi:iron(III) transport system substrate-binding protein